MKRRVFLFVMAAVLCLCICTAAFAIELTWDQACTKKTSRATMLYVQVEGEDFLRETSMLPAGTYIRTTGQSKDGKTGISYSANNCDPLYGYIDNTDGKVIVSAVQTVTLPSGKTVKVGEALVRSRQALNLWLEMEYGEKLDGTTYVDENGEEHEIGNEEAAGVEHNISGDMKYYSALNNAFINNGAETPTFYRDDAGNEKEVQVVYMGVLRSMVVLDGEQQLVDTCRLSWETDAPEEKVLAVVHPLQNKLDVKFHSGSSTKSMVLGRVKSNRVVQVIRTGKEWTLVDLHEEGFPRVYIATMYLDFWSNIPRDYETAMITIKGKTKSKEPIGVRAGDSSNNKKVEEFYPGEALTVYARNNKWCEVDVHGYHAFILTKFVTVDGLTAEVP